MSNDSSNLWEQANAPGSPEPTGMDPAEKSRGKLIAIVVALVLLFGGIIGGGIWWFTRNTTTAQEAAKGITPEQAVKGWYDALAKNQPQALWAAQPPSLKEELTTRIKKMGASAAQKPRLYQKGMGVARNFAQLIRNKKDVFLGLLNYKPKEINTAVQLGNLQSTLGSLLDGNAPAGNAQIPGANELVGNLANAQIAAMMKQYKVEPWKFDATAGILFTLLDSDIKNIDWLQNPDLDGFVSKTGGALMKQLDAIPAQEGKDSWSTGFKTPLSNIQVKTISQDGNVATVEVNYPEMAFLGTGAGVRTLQLVLVSGEWKLAQPDLIFGAMQAGIAGVDAKVKTMENYQALASQLGGLGGADEESMIQGLDLVDNLIVEIDRDVRTTDDFVAFLRKKFMGNLDAALGGKLDILGGAKPKPKPIAPAGNDTNKPPLAGAIPNRPAGTTNNIAQPINLTNPNAPKGTHRNFLWLAYSAQASVNFGKETGYSIDKTFLTKRQELIMQAFGYPDDLQNGKWTYRTLRVYDMRKRAACQTVVFSIANGRVASVVCY
jgi:hypothetical protein